MTYETTGGIASLEEIAKQAVAMVEEIFLGMIDLLVSSLVDALIWLFHDALMKPFITEFIGEFMINEKMLSLDESEIMGLLLNYCYQKMQIIGLATIILVAMWHLFKIYFSYFGQTPTEEGWKIGGKLILYGFLVVNSKKICLLVVGMFNQVAEKIGKINLTTESVGSLAYSVNMKKAIMSIYEILENAEFSRLETYGDLVKFCLILAIDIKLLKIAIDIAEKYMNVILMIVISPIAFACGVTKTTNKIFSKWVTFFTSAILYQCLQYTMIAMLYYVTDRVTSGEKNSGFIWEGTLEGVSAFRLLFIVWGILSIGQNAVSIIDDLGFASIGEGTNQLNRFIQTIPASRLLGDSSKAPYKDPSKKPEKKTSTEKKGKGVMLRIGGKKNGEGAELNIGG